jgi:hypothetical protein
MIATTITTRMNLIRLFPPEVSPVTKKNPATDFTMGRLKSEVLAPRLGGGVESQELSIQIGENALQMRAVSRIAGRLQRSEGPRPNHLKTLTPCTTLQFLGGGPGMGTFLGVRFSRADLILNGLAFPASSHVEIICPEAPV